MNRKIVVPGTPLAVSVVISDAMKTVVLAVPHAGEVVVVFVGSEPKARAMSEAQAVRFDKELRRIHQAIIDDAKIAQMEAELAKEREKPDE